MGCPLCHFEFASDDPERCQAFYSGVLGWEFDNQSMPGYALINTGSEPCGGLMKRPDEVPAPCLNVYFLVDDIPATLERVKAGGGTVCVEQTEIPNVGWWAFAMDPEGIPFGIFKTKSA